MADQEKEGANGRLLKRLQQRIGPAAFQVIGRVYDNCAPVTKSGPRGERLLQTADLIYGYAAF